MEFGEKHWKFLKMRNAHSRTWNMAGKLKIMENVKYTVRKWNMLRNTQKRGKWEMHSVGHGIWWENWKSRKMRNTHFRTWNMARKTEKAENFGLSAVGHGIWQENWKSWKMRNIQVTTWKMTKHWKTWKMRNAHCRTWNMARKLKITEYEKYTL